MKDSPKGYVQVVRMRRNSGDGLLNLPAIRYVVPEFLNENSSMKKGDEYNGKDL